jgi:glyceraldehyde-3-phosphate dehydrogenase/erythrose-4-phosphate dehydrogenase
MHAGEIKIVAINDLGDANTNAHLTRCHYDQGDRRHAGQGLRMV